MWLFFALLSALFAALTSILAKLGIDGVNSNLATAIRIVVVVVMAWGMVFLTHAQNGIFRLEEKAGFFSSCPALPPAPPGSATTVHYSWETPQKLFLWINSAL